MKTPESKPAGRISVLVDALLERQLAAAANEEDRTISSAVRLAIREWLKARPKPDNRKGAPNA